ncbi:MAG: bifunctional 4-hydroxy-3-methylbut-2-enyl diphosphate reductase/30S ribosomal protein S1 [Clostridia bacterium]|nr:bifunctional 4-hydroxy-3-methylbut-2-enyl diphosphate reductase/30S ribosomal protein S1 [Clostridia bacterium]
MELVVSKYLGYCFGVNRAITTLFQTIDACPDRKYYTYGPIIHNKRIIDQLARRGVSVIDDISLAEPGSLVFIRTHGVAGSVLRALSERGVEYVDLTCPYVQKIHNVAKESDLLLMVGDIRHPEVEGILGDAKGEYVAVKTLEELKQVLRSDPRRSFTMVAQTTFNMETWLSMKSYVESLRPSEEGYTDEEGIPVAAVRVRDTICHSTSDRQREVETMAKECDFIVVIGDKHSSNTKKLYEIAKNHCSACYIEDVTELPHCLSRYKKIGLSTGASTPGSTIEEVINNMINENNVNNLTEEDIDFAAALEASLQVARVGQRISGTVGVVGTNEIQVELGGKHTGFIPASEFSEEELKTLKAGDEVEAFVMKVSDVEGTVLLSKKKLDSIKGYEKLEAAKENNEILEGKVVEVVKGGVVVSVNSVRVFVPASLASLRKDTDLESMKNQEVRLRIIELENAGRRKRIIGSIRAVLKEEKDAAQAQVWESIEVGKKYVGVVKSLASFGAFVDIGGVDGLVHITDLAWTKLKHPSEIVKEGDSIEVEVKSFDPETRKISLVYKKSNEDPWALLPEAHNVGDVISVTVLKIMPYGAFVSVIPGIDGLVHISQVAPRRLEKVSDVLKVGDVVDAKITEINYETKKISLSIRDALPEEGEAVAADEAAEGSAE